jgi:hypothetical protein
MPERCRTKPRKAGMMPPRWQRKIRGKIALSG